MAKQRRKPTGARGPVHISGSLNEGITVEHLAVEFPTSKEEVEQLVANAFVSAASRTGILRAAIVDLQLNSQNDFDFTDAGAATPTYIELMEVAPLANVKGGYEAAPNSYNGYDFAESILEGILGKSTRYAVGDNTRLVLLLYVTDWKFDPGDTVLALLQFWTLQQPHVFSEIYVFRPISRDDGFSHLIYPTPSEFWNGFEPEAYRDNVIYNLNPTGWQLTMDPDA